MGNRITLFENEADSQFKLTQEIKEKSSKEGEIKEKKGSPEQTYEGSPIVDINAREATMLDYSSKMANN